MKIAVKVFPNSKEQKIKKELAGSLRVYLKSPAKEDKANKELVEVLADYFDVSKAEIEIVRGKKSRRKFVSIG